MFLRKNFHSMGLSVQFIEGKQANAEQGTKGVGDQVIHILNINLTENHTFQIGSQRREDCIRAMQHVLDQIEPGTGRKVEALQHPQEEGDKTAPEKPKIQVVRGNIK